MPRDNRSTATPASGQIGIIMGLLGLGAGVAAVLSGLAWLGLVAGVLALVGPTTMLREFAPAKLAARAEAPSHIDEEDDEAPVTFGEAAAALSPSDAQPFHADSELLTAEYFGIAVRNRMTAARRFLKPLAVAQVLVSNADESDDSVAKLSAAVLDTLRNCDTAYVMGRGHLALVLEDTPESGAIWAVERIRRNLMDTDDELTVWAGIACYPAHGMDSDEIITQCQDALVRAQEWPQDRIEVAFAD